MPTKTKTNPFLNDTNHFGEITVGQLVEVVNTMKGEFPLGLDTKIKIGDVEGNNGVTGNVLISWHRKGDIVLSIDPNSGDTDYDAVED